MDGEQKFDIVDEDLKELGIFWIIAKYILPYLIPIVIAIILFLVARYYWDYISAYIPDTQSAAAIIISILVIIAVAIR